MSLLPQDIVLLLKMISVQRITLPKNDSWTRAAYAASLGLSSSQIQYAMERLQKASLVVKVNQRMEVHIQNSKEFLIHALKYFAPPVRGEMTRGIPTMWAASPVKKYFSSQDIPPVWPCPEIPDDNPETMMKGYTFEPIHSCAVHGAIADGSLRSLLVIADTLRAGKAREKKIAKELLEEYFEKNYESN